MIIIPMAGLSSRFTKAGYTQPKYMLPLDGQSVFAHSVKSFQNCFDSHPFLFIARDVGETAEFLRHEISELGIKNAQTVFLNHATAGQAETVEIGLKKASVSDATPLTIFNIDTFRKDYSFPTAPWFEHSAGYLEVFKGSGANWSYVEPAPERTTPEVIRTAEKQPISDLCCDGLYHFARSEDFHFALENERQKPSSPELYIAPLYNALIKKGLKIHYDLIPADLITFCGVPAEYESLLKNAS